MQQTSKEAEAEAWKGESSSDYDLIWTILSDCSFAHSRKNHIPIFVKSTLLVICMGSINFVCKRVF